jgi:hypothetical protein
METHGAPDPTAARAALSDVAGVQERLADRAASTWWYRVGLGLGVAVVFALFGLGDVIGFGWAAVVIAVLSVVLVRALRWTSGVSVDRYGAVPATRRTNVVYQVGLFALLIPGAVLALGLDVPWAMVPFAVAVFGWVQVMERRIDADLRRGLAA